MTAWVGLIAVVLAYLSVGAVLATERLQGAVRVVDEVCACGCDIYDRLDGDTEEEAQRKAVIAELASWWALPAADVNR